MTYFSKFLINPQRRGARKLLTSPQALHAAVMATNPPDIKNEDGRILWRLDITGHQYVLYVLSPEKPDFSALVEQAGWNTRPGESAHYGRLLSKLEDGQEWGFRLAANPVKRQGESGKTWPHVTPIQQSAWLRERAQQWGFEVIPVENQEIEDAPLVTALKNLSFSRRDSGGHLGRVTLRKVQFDGVLRITDVELFRKALVNGMGRGKAYGMGLMTLAPLAR
ncbi:type I-E CRISPR-associated protein Cas6/Cse3/CasE [Rothia dentocariosa]|uniref:type I-E CRISPR-associated protein Cas6/Cse3/CasE n=1 Tax=Rothia dentocariosa TaxID=2047 RepID=UPI0028801DF4|nr:type I-E CRISPR-associated protein Cas6/Cse3/CasE [Rothia dentocariosa]